MKRNLLLLLAGSILMLLLAPAIVAQNQPSLGEVARLARRHKPAPAPGERVYDNDNLPGKAIVNTVGPPPTSDQAASDQSASSDANKEKSAVPSNDEQKKINGDWTGKITQQKEEISRLERELNVLQRESKINASVNAADLGTRLGNNAKYAEQDRQYQEQIAAKQKAVDDAKQKLLDMQEEARKSGVPASARD
ncbi:MAG TPA: hypothetical protein VK738_09185 [Terriglobales bacterium]|jgi:septal ring factor EnvC (AmiA/AmiB activator)|nr:hypothetical protein [Terriglobales bacterium]